MKKEYIPAVIAFVLAIAILIGAVAIILPGRQEPVTVPPLPGATVAAIVYPPTPVPGATVVAIVYPTPTPVVPPEDMPSEYYAKLYYPYSYSLLEQKKQKLLDIAAVSFVYVDKEAIQDFYNQTFKEPTVTDLVETLIEKQTAEIGSGELTASVLRSELGGENLKEYIRTIKLPETTEAEMFLRYQRYILENNKVSYGFDEIDITLAGIGGFEDEIAALEDRYHISFSDAIKQAKKEEIKGKLVDDFLAELEKVTQWVLVEGEYRLTDESDKTYKLTYEHPINEHLAHLPGARVQIVCFLNKDLVESRYSIPIEMTASQGKAIPINIFGKVWQPIDTEINTWELIITPYAIY